jgi:hypothetical protein
MVLCILEVVVTTPPTPVGVGQPLVRSCLCAVDKFQGRTIKSEFKAVLRLQRHEATVVTSGSAKQIAPPFRKRHLQFLNAFMKTEQLQKSTATPQPLILSGSDRTPQRRA